MPQIVNPIDEPQSDAMGFLQHLGSSNSIFGDSGDQNRIRAADDQHKLAQLTLAKIQRQMALEDDQRAAQQSLVRQMGSVAAGQSQPSGDLGSVPAQGPPSPGGTMPSVPVQGPPEANYTRDESAQMRDLGYQHARELDAVAGFAARAGLDTKEAALALNWTHEQHLQQAETVRRQQNAQKLAQQFQAGAFGDPKSPAVQAKGQELAQLAVDPGVHPDEVWKAAAPTLAAVDKEWQDQQDRQQHTAQMQADAEAIAAYTHKPLNPVQTGALREMATHQGDSKELRTLWDTYYKFGLVPVPDAMGKTQGVPFDQADQFRTDQQALAVRLREAEIAAREAQAGLANARAGSGGFAPRGLRLPELDQADARLKNAHAGLLEQETKTGRRPSAMPLTGERETVFNELLKANPGLASQPEADQNAAIDRAMRVKSGQPAPVVPEEPGFFSKLFGGGATPTATTPQANSGAAPAGAPAVHLSKTEMIDRLVRAGLAGKDPEGIDPADVTPDVKAAVRQRLKAEKK